MESAPDQSPAPAAPTPQEARTIDGRTLLRGATDEGVRGFIYEDTMTWGPAENPEDAAELMANLNIDADGYIRVPVYKADGVTQLGYFTAGRVTSS